MLRALDSSAYLVIENTQRAESVGLNAGPEKLYEIRSGYTICVEWKPLIGIRKVNNLYTLCKQFVYIIES